MLSQYLAPLAQTPDDKKLGWLKDAAREARLFLEQQPGYARLNDDIEVVRRSFPEMLPGQNTPALYGQVRPVVVNRTKAQIDDIVSTLGNLRPLWNYTPNDREYVEEAKILNKCSWAWWHNTYADLSIFEALQWSAVNRTGYIVTSYDPHFHGPYQGDIKLSVGGPSYVLPLWMGRDFNLQKGYAVIVVERMPTVETWQTWPEFKEFLKPDKEQQDAPPRGLPARIIRGAKALFEGDDEGYQGTVPYTTVYHMYIRDMSKNMTRNTIPMGIKGENSYYEVPAFGSDIPTGFVNPSTGQDLTRKAMEEDTLLYPGRRHITFTEKAVLYDGPNRWFHGRAPVVKFTLDPWPWDYLGGSMVDDVRSVHESNNNLRQKIEKSARLRINPPVMFDEDQYEKSFMETKPLDQEGEAFAANFLKGDAIRPIFDPRYYDIPQWILEFMKTNDDLSNEQIGRMDFQALARARQMPSGDTQEQFLRLTGSRTHAKSHHMERAMAELALQVKGLILQWYDAPTRYKLFGFQGITEADFDYDPGTLVPDTVPGVRPGQKVTSKSTIGWYRYQRAKVFQHAFKCQIEPYSLHEISSMTRQLLYMRLYEGGKFPMDSWTLGETLRVPNMGNPPDTTGDTLPERFVTEQTMRAEIAAYIQARAQQIMMQNDPQQQLMGKLQEMAQQFKKPEGRPPSYNEPPKLEEKMNPDGSQRTTLTTSK
jgi:hypothetical protein